MEFANDPIARRIREAAGRGTLSHALLFSGSGDRIAAAQYAAAAMECQGGGQKPCGTCPACRKVFSGIHPDVITVRDEAHKNLSVDTVRQIRADAYIRPNEGARKVYIFPDCTILTEQDQNVLLKIVEEGPPYAAFLFCAENSSVVLQTLRSRCVELKLHPAAEGGGEEVQAAEALCRCLAARKRGKQARIVIDREHTAAETLIARLDALPEYSGVFLTPAEAFLQMRADTLLVVVDTNRPDMVENPQLLESCNRVAVIDHHRRAATYIENAAFNFHEPYASSASELVTELLQYLVEPTDLLREEAGALLAGIVLDTKHFTQRTGGRTFEAAAFLRRSGADTAEVQRLFQGDLKDMVTKYDIIRRAEMYRSNIAVSVVEEPGVDRVAAAQAADDLLTLKGVQASFVIYAAEGAVLMSARSLGEINVQVILEALGGGGNSTTAGARIEDTDPESVRQQLIGVLDAYFEK